MLSKISWRFYKRLINGLINMWVKNKIYWYIALLESVEAQVL